MPPTPPSTSPTTLNGDDGRAVQRNGHGILGRLAPSPELPSVVDLEAIIQDGGESGRAFPDVLRKRLFERIGVQGKNLQLMYRDPRIQAEEIPAHWKRLLCDTTVRDKVGALVGFFGRGRRR
jgi:hypothetical protein